MASKSVADETLETLSEIYGAGSIADLLRQYYLDYPNSGKYGTAQFLAHMRSKGAVGSSHGDVALDFWRDRHGISWGDRPTCVGLWKVNSHVANAGSGRVLKDLSGRRHHMYAGSTKIGTILDGMFEGTAVAGNYASTPDSAALSITGDIDLRADVTPTDLTNAASIATINKYTNVGNQRAYILSINPTGGVRLTLSADGVTPITTDSSVALPTIDGQRVQIRATWRQSDGRIQFFYRIDNSLVDSGWTQLGTDQTAAIASIFDSTAILEIGSSASGTVNMWWGAIHRTIVKSGINGTTVLDVDFSTQADRTMSFVCSTGQTITINQSAATTNDPKLLPYDTVNGKYVYLPGITGNYLTAADSAALSVTSDITIDILVALDDWTPTLNQILFSKSNATSDQRGYVFFVDTTGKLQLQLSADGINIVSGVSSVVTGITDGTIKWLRVTWNNGTNITKFFTSNDGVIWTQLGADVAQALTGIFDSSDIVRIGENAAGTTPGAGKFYAAKVYNSDLGSGSGTPVFDWRATDMVEPFATVVERSVNAATVTVVRTATGRKTTVVDRSLMLFGTDDYMEAFDHADFDIALTDSFTAVVVMRDQRWETGVSAAIIAKKISTGSTIQGWAILRSATADRLTSQLGDGTNTTNPSVDNPGENGIAGLIGFTRDVAADTVTAYFNGLSASMVDALTGTSGNAEVVRIGRLSGAGASFWDGMFMAAAIFREALTQAQINLVAEELLVAAA